MRINFYKLNPRKLWGTGLIIFGVVIFLLTMFLAETYENSELYKLGIVVGIIPFSISGYFIFASGFFEKKEKLD